MYISTFIYTSHMMYIASTYIRACYMMYIYPYVIWCASSTKQKVFVHTALVSNKSVHDPEFLKCIVLQNRCTKPVGIGCFGANLPSNRTPNGPSSKQFGHIKRFIYLGSQGAVASQSGHILESCDIRSCVCMNLVLLVQSESDYNTIRR